MYRPATARGLCELVARRREPPGQVHLFGISEPFVRMNGTSYGMDVYVTVSVVQHPFHAAVPPAAAGPRHKQGSNAVRIP